VSGLRLSASRRSVDHGSYPLSQTSRCSRDIRVSGTWVLSPWLLLGTKWLCVLYTPVLVSAFLVARSLGLSVDRFAPQLPNSRSEFSTATNKTASGRPKACPFHYPGSRLYRPILRASNRPQVGPKRSSPDSRSVAVSFHFQFVSGSFQLDHQKARSRGLFLTVTNGGVADPSMSRLGYGRLYRLCG